MSERTQFNRERSYLPPGGFLTAVALGGLGAVVAGDHTTPRAEYMPPEQVTLEYPKTGYPEVILPAYNAAHRAVGSLALEAARRRTKFDLAA